jgi:hypothetical protein
VALGTMTFGTDWARGTGGRKCQAVRAVRRGRRYPHRHGQQVHHGTAESILADLLATALARLDQASHITRGFPHDFLASADFIFGGMSGQLDPATGPVSSRLSSPPTRTEIMGRPASRRRIPARMSILCASVQLVAAEPARRRGSRSPRPADRQMTSAAVLCFSWRRRCGFRGRPEGRRCRTRVTPPGRVGSATTSRHCRSYQAATTRRSR